MAPPKCRKYSTPQTEVCELFHECYGRFTEGFDTLDLKEAKVLLEELAFNW
jgi:hypothetical protein